MMMKLIMFFCDDNVDDGDCDEDNDEDNQHHTGPG